VIVEVGLSRYLEARQAKEIAPLVEQSYGPTLPETTINYLARRFLDLLAAAHEALTPALKQWLERTRGGYLLHLDGTCEAGTGVCFVAVDGESQFVLLSSKIPSENVKDLESFLRECVSLFGPPLATVRDLSENLRLARDNVLGDLPDFVCQHHLLENIGEKLCSSLSTQLDRALRRHRIKSTLSHNARQLQSDYRKQTPIPQEQFEASLQEPGSDPQLNTTQLRRQLHVHLIAWVQDYTHDLAGEYFPFDQPVLAFYQRCRKMLDWLNTFLRNTQLSPSLRKPFENLRERLSPTQADPEIVAAAHALQTAVDQFLELRALLRLEDIQNQSRLRQHPSASTTPEEARTIEEEFQRYREKLDQEIAQKDQAPLRAQNARKIAATLDKYWEHLFGHILYPPGCETPVIVKRTNYPCEHSFSRRKRSMRRQTGNAKLAKRLDSAHPAEILVENLKNPDYLQLLCGGRLDQLPRDLAAYWPTDSRLPSRSSSAPVEARIHLRKSILRSKTFFEQTAQAIEYLSVPHEKAEENARIHRVLFP